MDYTMMRELRRLDILSEQPVHNWGHVFDSVAEDFKEWFGENGSWQCPEVRVVEKNTGVEMNSKNWESIMAQNQRGTLDPMGQGQRGVAQRLRRTAIVVGPNHIVK
jgi:hypothetical protein